MRQKPEKAERQIELCGRLTALLEHRARLRGNVSDLHLYYLRGSLPQTEILNLVRTDLNTVQPYLAANDHPQPQLDALNKVIQQLDTDPEENQTFRYYVTWAHYLLTLPRNRNPELPSINQAQIHRYAEGYLHQRRELDPSRPPPPAPETENSYHWQYQTGRQITYEIAAQHSQRTPTELFAIKDAQELGLILT